MSSSADAVPEIRSAAMAFVRGEAGFAQVVSTTADGYPVGRTASAFLRDDWTVDLVQRRQHQRNRQLAARGQVLIVWTGTPTALSRNDFPAVFDLGLTIPRVVFIQGDATALDDETTWQVYHAQHTRLASLGHTRAPSRTPEQVSTELLGWRVLPRRIRLEGFDSGAQAHSWTVKGETA